MSHWPQIVVLFLALLGFAFHCAKAGQPRAPFNPVADLISSCITVWLLYEGGFFAVWGWTP